jgi:site-specific DNA recombinase
MTSTNGHGPKRAILYARVSTDEQARSGYSLAQQIEALRDHAAREGYEVLEEVKDPGQSGASLERPGMDRVRDLVAGGGVSVVLAQDRDRFAREPAYHYLLRREFEEHGTKIRALNDRGDDSPEGELTDAILDQLAKFERAKTAERTRRGKLRKVREGKVLAGPAPDFGFQYNDSRDGYEVDEAQMGRVRDIFRLVAVEGRTLHAVKRALENEGVRTPKGGEFWSTIYLRERILDDVYKPHTIEEVNALVEEGLMAPEVASRLETGLCYGIWWYNRRRITHTQVSEAGPGGRRYRRTTKTENRPRSEWIAVPVLDAGIPREWVDAARHTILSHRQTSNRGRRFWELSGGLLRCPGCGCAMTSATTVQGERSWNYYRCHRRAAHGARSCPQKKTLRAEPLENAVWQSVSDLLTDPERLRVGLEDLIAQEQSTIHGDPLKQTEALTNTLENVAGKRRRYQDMAAEGLISFDELRSRLAELEDTRKTTERELESLRRRRDRIAELEHDGILMEQYAELIPAELELLAPEERRRVYSLLRLQVVPGQDGTVEMTGVIGAANNICQSQTTSG